MNINLKFKKGDLIKCIDDECIALIYEKTYVVTKSEDREGIFVVDEEGDEAYYFNSRFELDNIAIRNATIQEILS